MEILKERIFYLSTFWGSLLLKRNYLSIFRETGRDGEREGEKHQSLKRSQLGTWPATQACAPDWELIQHLPGLQDDAQPTEPHQPGLSSSFTIVSERWAWLVWLLSLEIPRNEKVVTFFHSVQLSCPPASPVFPWPYLACPLSLAVGFHLPA